MRACICEDQGEDESCEDEGEDISAIDSKKLYDLNGNHICYKRAEGLDYFDIAKYKRQYQKSTCG
jgi:hypothetical protein